MPKKKTAEAVAAPETTTDVTDVEFAQAVVDAQTSARDLAQNGWNVQLISLDHIADSPTNPRKSMDPGALKELAASITAHGVIQPVTVRELPHAQGAYELVVGHRRTHAARLAGTKTIPAVVMKMSDNEVRELQLVENIQREDVSILEEVEAFNDLIQNHGYTTASLATAIGKSKRLVQNRLSLLKLGDSARAAVADGRMDPSVALALTSLPKDEQDEFLLWHRMRAGELATLTARGVELALEAWQNSQAAEKGENVDDEEVASDKPSAKETAKQLKLKEKSRRDAEERAIQSKAASWAVAQTLSKRTWRQKELRLIIDAFAETLGLEGLFTICDAAELAGGPISHERGDDGGWLAEEWARTKATEAQCRSILVYLLLARQKASDHEKVASGPALALKELGLKANAVKAARKLIESKGVAE